MKATRAGKDEFVRLSDPVSGVTVNGRLKLLRSGVTEVRDTIKGLTLDNYAGIRPSDFHGVSHRLGGVWLSNILKFEPSISFELSIPSIVRLQAIDAFFGDFDPRCTRIYSMRASLGKLSFLDARGPIEWQEISSGVLKRHYNITGSPEIIYENDRVQVVLAYSVSLGEQVTYDQFLRINFKGGEARESAIRTFDAVFLLISIVTQSNIMPRVIVYSDGKNNRAMERRVLRRSKVPLCPREWLCTQESIVAFLREGLESWLKALEVPENFTLAQWFIAAAHSTRTIESAYLLFCQCFEDLNRRRIGRCQYPEQCFDKNVVVPLSSAIASLDGVWIKSDLRSRLNSAVKSSNVWRFRDRVGETMELLPRFRETVKSEIADIRGRIEHRRNTLSHGNPLGGASNHIEFRRLSLETTVMRALCLAELLLLAGVNSSAVDNLVHGDHEMRTFAWRCSRA